MINTLFKRLSFKDVKTRFKTFEESASQLLSRLLKLLGLVAMCLVAFATIKNVFVVKHSLVPFNVPASFAESGVSGEYLIWQLNDEFLAIQKSGWSINGLYLDIQEETEIQQDVMIFGNSLNGAISLIRDILGIKNRTITGSLVKKQDTLHLRVSVSDMPTIVTEVDIKDYSDVFIAYDALIRNAAKDILLVVDPFVLASYYWATANQQGFLETVAFIVDSKHENTDQAYVLWGEYLFESSDYVASASKFEMAVQLAPENDIAWTGWGAALSFAGELDKGIAKFEKATGISPDNEQTWFKWGDALFWKEDYRGAIAKFKKVIDMSPQLLEAYNQIAYSFLALEQPDKSEEYLLMGIANVDDPAFLYATLSEVYWSQGKQEAAFDSLSTAVELGFDPTPYTDDEPYRSFTKK